MSRMLLIRNALTIFGLLGAILLHAPTPVLAQAFLEDIGYNALVSELGSSVPDGAGVGISQIEAPDLGNYAPTTTLPSYSGITFTLKSGPSGASSHANNFVSPYLFGTSSTSMAQGVTTVDLYEAGNFLFGGYLQQGSTSAPLIETSKVQNHSWILWSTASEITTNAALATQISRRMDFAIARDNFTAVFGLNNGSSTVIPGLMGQTHNGIVVGRSDGNHSTGATTIDGTGRSKPDIVAPAGATSTSTPIVAAAATLLWSHALDTFALNAAADSRVVKALLMAGATKKDEEFSDLWSRTDSQPLDAHYGAGELNIYNSYQILDAGPSNASSTSFANPLGWSKANSADSELTWFFEVIAGSEFSEFSAILTWNRTVTHNINWSSINSSLTNLNLRFYEADTSFTLGSLLQQSISTVDNVEHIYFSAGLAAGIYALRVEKPVGTDPDVDFALAWHAEVIPEPSTYLLLTLALLLFVGARRTFASPKL
jgi:hypothetical protein